MRQIILDTETTGLEPRLGHRIIEIGCVEVIDRRITGNSYHQYINPEREIDEGAVEVHGITTAFLADKPCFIDVVDDFLKFIRGAELVIHNAPFDVGFIDHELTLLGQQQNHIASICTVLDTLVLARKMHPGQKNNLDALCKRYDIDNSQRDLHGALLDAEILAETYLAMTGGQTLLLLGGEAGHDGIGQQAGFSRPRAVNIEPDQLRIIRANELEMAAHETRLATINDISGGSCVWFKG
ncbi:MAG: DNA polymerase III subunit epsilon, partial [Gammaproteobacteria bacterium]|nr:DNA polymerase III subunit epsilon [Gammaproteobacteria bacterium]